MDQQVLYLSVYVKSCCFSKKYFLENKADFKYTIFLSLMTLCFVFISIHKKPLFFQKNMSILLVVSVFIMHNIYKKL